MSSLASHGRGRFDRVLRVLATLSLVAAQVALGAETVIAATETLKDEFNAISYGNDDGSLTWLTAWEEVGEATDPTSGDWQVVQDGSFAAYSLEKRGAADSGVQRVADLTGFTTATLRFDYRRESLA
ncbi:MAG TPA: hypothetical protein EYP73_02735, partial [Acidimicrobiia bacterium]|nr:hypothetical protein [Acidimicrobiia bacterium]